MNQTIEFKPFTLLRLAVNILQQNPSILYPTITLVFIQLLALEILYFSPRYPLSDFFGPLIQHIWSEEFLHYPLNLVLLPKMFYYAQIFIYIFIGSFLLGVTTRIVAVLNEHPKVNIKTAYKECRQFYIPILCSSILSFLIFQLLSDSYTALLNSLLKIKSADGSSIFLSKILIWGTPYVQFLIGIIVTILLIFLVPIIILEKRRIFPALILNFKTLLKTFPTTFFIVFIPTLFYLPILVARNNIIFLTDASIPEVQIVLIVAGLAVTMAIDLIILTAITTLYIFMKETV